MKIIIEDSDLEVIKDWFASYKENIEGLKGFINHLQSINSLEMASPIAEFEYWCENYSDKEKGLI